MELWIRSQDKEALIKVDKIFYWNTCPEMQNTGKHYLGNKEWAGIADYTKLGEYKTKERALEVLDEIQDILKPTIITTSYECECKNNPTNKMKFDLEMVPQKTEIQELSTYVYEMPKE